MRKVFVILTGVSAVFVLTQFAWTGEIEVLYEGNWKVLKTELIKGGEYVSLVEVADVTGGRLLRDGLRVNGGTFHLVEGQAGVIVGDTTFLLSSPPVKQEGVFCGPVVWLGKERYNLRLLRHHAYPDYTRIVIEALEPLNFRVDEDDDGLLNLHVEGGILSPVLSDAVRINDGLIEKVEPTQGRKEAVFRIYRDAFGGLTRAFALRNPDRIVVDLHRAKAGTARSSPGVPPTGLKRRQGLPAPSVSPPAPLATIAIDPGHGGRDTGAVGRKGLQEKEVVLDIALRLRRLIQERLGVRVVMTRTEDVFVPLEERTAIANRAKADFFISIHVNAAPRSKAQGFETYYLSREPSDSVARASAIRENLAVNLGGLKPREQEALRAILWDMANTLYIRESSELARMLLDELDKILKVENRGVKSAPFFVLMGAAMPAVLVEVAFISNGKEEKKLQNERYRNQVAEALYSSVARFKARYERRLGLTRPPPAGRPVRAAER